MEEAINSPAVDHLAYSVVSLEATLLNLNQTLDHQVEDSLTASLVEETTTNNNHLTNTDNNTQEATTTTNQEPPSQVENSLNRSLTVAKDNLEDNFAVEQALPHLAVLEDIALDYLSRPAPINSKSTHVISCDSS